MSDPISVRVLVLDSLDEIPLQLDPGSVVSEAKRQALTAARAGGQPADYLVKYRGAEVPESATVEQAGVVANAHLIVLRRRRRPVR